MDPLIGMILGQAALGLVTGFGSERLTRYMVEGTGRDAAGCAFSLVVPNGIATVAGLVGAPAWALTHAISYGIGLYTDRNRGLPTARR